MTTDQENNVSFAHKASFTALIPFFAFIVFYFGLSLAINDFYKVPMIIAFVIASAVSMCLDRKTKLGDKIEIYAKGMGDVNIMIMCLIFVLAGIFTGTVKGMGAVDSVITIARNFIPQNLFLIGFFLISCFISLAMGTSCGTIAAVTPIAAGLIAPLHINPALMIGAVIGGSMFGDNLSVISDTTIAATRTQSVKMRDKFFANIKIVVPAVILTIIIYLCAGQVEEYSSTVSPVTARDYLAALPYIAVLVLAIAGVNVMALLFSGTILAYIIGIMTGAFDFWNALDLCGKGALDMSETLIVAILAGGMLGIIRYNGGINYIIKKISLYASSPKGCEFGIFLLVSIINLFTANNTVAIVIAGPIAKDLSQKFQCNAKRIASILDTASCTVQGIIPYGAQILIAMGIVKIAGITEISTWELISHMYYPMFIGISTLASILLTKRTAK